VVFAFSEKNAAQIELHNDSISRGQFDRSIMIKKRDSTVLDIDFN
jgi:hypothetical protein